MTKNWKSLLMTTLLAACTSSPSYWIAFTPHAGHASSKEAAMQKATIAITDAGREIESSDPAMGIILTKWFSGTGMVDDQNRFRIRVLVQTDGSYEISGMCQRMTIDTKHWEQPPDGHCGNEGKFPRFVVELTDKLDVSMRP